MAVDEGALGVGIAAAVLALLSLVLTVVWRESAKVKARAARLADLKKQYSEAVQPAMSWLDGLKRQHPGGRLWAALQFEPLLLLPQLPLLPIRPSADDLQRELTARQLLASHMEEFQREQRSRNQVKGFWEALVKDVDEGNLPATFVYGGKHKLLGSTLLGQLFPGLVLHRLRRRQQAQITAAAALAASSAQQQPVATSTWKEEMRPITFANKKWLFRAKGFRELVEPFDIANFYRMGLNKGVGGNRSYHEAGRSGLYIRLQDMEVAALKAAGGGVYQSSLVWAEAAAAAVQADPVHDGPPALQADLAPLAPRQQPP